MSTQADVPVKDREKGRRVQSKESVMWTGVRTSGGTANRITTMMDAGSHGDRQPTRINSIQTSHHN